MKFITLIPLYFIGVLFLASCAMGAGNHFSPAHSYLKGTKADLDTTKEQISNVTQQASETQQRFRFVAPIKLNTNQAKTAEDTLSRFSDTKTIKISADELPLGNYLHHVLGELLELSYILTEEVKKDTQPITLNLQDSLTERKLFTLTEEILTQRGYLIRVDDNIFYIHKIDKSGPKGDVVYGYGNNYEDIPQTSLDIIQMVPFVYGFQTSLGNTLRQLIGINVTTDLQRGNLIIQGKRKDILRAVELIQLMDQPALQNRQIGLFKTSFLTTGDLVKKLTELLSQEGISVGEGKDIEKTLSVIQLDKQGMLVFFANNQQIIERAVFWAKEIDKPINTLEKQYFIFQPQYSRAIDMGESLQALFGNTTGGISGSTTLANQNIKTNQKSTAVQSINTQNMKMVVDERANALIFYTSGQTYQQLYPLINRLDILPKQVILEVMIAEVSLINEFKQGVEFAFSKGKYGVSTLGAFMGDGFGGLSYLFQGSRGDLAINLLETNSLVNVLSRPTLVVRDGVSASINVGTDIPVIGETSSDPINGERQTTKIEYRKTGVELTVTPTVNAQGIVLMEISQMISNEVSSGSTASLSPSIFVRSITTEVVAASGQTIMLGGLISENKSKVKSRVPLVADIPLIGSLFKAETDSGDKTELIVLVTPRIIESTADWDDIIKNFNKGVTQLKINQ